MGQSKWRGEYFSLSLLAKFGGYCRPAYYQDGQVIPFDNCEKRLLFLIVL